MLAAKKFQLSNTKAKEIVEDNLGLLKYFAGIYQVQLWNYDEAYAIALESLLKAASRFDETKDTKLSTYAYTYIQRDLVHETILHNKHIFKRLVFDEELYESNNGQRDIQLDIQTILGNLTESQRNVIQWLWLDGYTLQEIGKVLNVSHQRVAQIEKTAINNLRKIYSPTTAVSSVHRSKWKLNKDIDCKRTRNYKTSGE